MTDTDGLTDSDLTESVPDTKEFLGYVAVSRKRARLYSCLIAVLVLWVAFYVWVVAIALPSAIYWLSYYAVDYSFGFVRRGLGGSVVALFPPQYYFPVSYLLMSASVVAFFGSLALLARWILVAGTPAERRLLVALLIPALPFAVTFALFGPRPELFGVATLVLFSLALTRVSTTKAAVIASAAFGAAIMVLTLVHEAIPQEFTLGAILAIAVLPAPMKAAHRWLCLLIALGPAALTAGAVLTFGHRNLGDELCDHVPHKMIRNSYQVPSDKVIDYITGRYQSRSDYHEWVCSYVMPYFNASFSAAIRSVLDLGIPVLIGGFLHGVFVCAVTVWVIRHFTGVRAAEFIDAITINKVVPLLGFAAMIPVFATGADWIRWWTIITINIATVYLAFAARRPEIESPVSRRDLKAFVAIVAIFIVVPLTAPAGYSSRWSDGYTWTPQNGWVKTH